MSVIMSTSLSGILVSGKAREGGRERRREKKKKDKEKEKEKGKEGVVKRYRNIDGAS